MVPRMLGYRRWASGLETVEAIQRLVSVWVTVATRSSARDAASVPNQREKNV